MVAIMVDSHNLRSVMPEPVDKEILLQPEALIAGNVIVYIGKDCNYTEI